MTAAEQAMQAQLAGPTIALLDDMPADLWTRLSTRLSSATAAAAQVGPSLPARMAISFDSSLLMAKNGSLFMAMNGNLMAVCFG